MMTSSTPAAPGGYTISFEHIASDDLPRVGGKGANLGALTRAGIPVPPGLCVTTSAFDAFMSALPDPDARVAALETLDGTEASTARPAADDLRAPLASVPMPPQAGPAT